MNSGAIIGLPTAVLEQTLATGFSTAARSERTIGRLRKRMYGLASTLGWHQ